jgi:hypothetical protein
MPESSTTHLLVRPDDQLRLRLELVNGELDRTTNTIRPLLGEEPIYYVFSFESQHLVEDQVPSGTVPSAGPVEHRVAGDSRLTVKVPPGTPFTVAAILDLAASGLVLDERATGNDTDGGDEPARLVTAIEVPTSLVLSPTPASAFVAGATPVTRGDVSELWRARLAHLQDGAPVEPPAGLPAVRAIWSRPDDPPFDRPVDADHRENLVTQTTGPESTPILINQLWLSSQGAFLDADGSWPAEATTSYRHRAVTGRDLRVEVVDRGYLAPFGHQASISTVSERVFSVDSDGVTVAALVSDEFLAITGHTVEFPVAYMPHDGRAVPFAAVSATDPGNGPIGGRRVTMPNGSSINQVNARILTRDGADLRISYTATDQGGQGGISFDLPVVFVFDDKAYEPRPRVNNRRTVLEKLAVWYADTANSGFSEAHLSAQPVTWAQPPDDPALGRAGSLQTTNRIRFRLDRPDVAAHDPATIEGDLRKLGRPAFFPAVDRAWVVDPSSTRAFGGTPPELEVTVAQRYLHDGLNETKNIDLGYLDLEAPAQLTPTTQAAGMISTDLNVDTFGQRVGGGVDPRGGTTWDPADALAGLPKLLGNLTLVDLVGEIDLLDPFATQGLPAIEVSLIPGEGPSDPPIGACIRFSWEPRLRSFPAEGTPKTFVVTDDFEPPLPDPADAFDGEQTRALLSLRTCIPGDTTFEASLERFALQLPPFAPAVAIVFRRVQFRDVNGMSSVDTDIADWSFINALNWLEPVKDLLLDTLGLGSPTFDGGIFIDFELPVPGFALGIVGVQGLEIALGVDLPNAGSSSVEFGMCSRERPFTITVLGFGGTGSFGVQVDATDIVYIEGSLAVCYELAVDFVIATASVSVAFGAFVQYQAGVVEFGAYVQVTGSVSIIGLIKITGQVTVALIYSPNTKILRGVAVLTGEVSSLFGKRSVSHELEVEVTVGDRASRLVAGLLPAAAGDAETVLSFRDRFCLSEWQRYCGAFAA